MKRISVITLMCFISLLANASTWYFSSSTGNDANTTTQAHSQSTPWKTLSKLNSMLGSNTITTGDIVLFKSGEVFPSSLRVIMNRSNITFGIYGGTDKAEWNGLTNITGWTVYNSTTGVYSANFTGPQSNYLRMLLINGKEYAMGRTPNATGLYGGFYQFESSTSSSVTDNDNPPFDSANYAKKSDIIVRTSNYTYDKGILTDINGTTAKTFTYTKVNFRFSTPDHNGASYFIQNNVRTLDQFGEWYYDSAAHKIYVCFGVNTPTSYTVQGSTNDIMLAPQANNFTMQWIKMVGANQYAVWNDWPLSNYVYQHCDFNFIGIDGLFLPNKKGLVFDDCNWNWCNSNGVMMTTHDSGCAVINSRLRDIGRLIGMASADDDVHRAEFGILYTGIYGVSYTGHNVSAMLIQHDSIQRIGYCGTFTAGPFVTIRDNFVDSNCLNLQDGSGIYQGNYTISGQVPKVDSFIYVLNNIVLRSLGAVSGSGGSTNMAHGIYWDDNSNNVVTKYNTCAYNGFSGIFIHNTNRSTISNNFLYGNGTCQFYVGDDDIGDSVYADIVTNNVMVATTSSQYMYYFQLQANSSPAKNGDFDRWFTRVDSNYAYFPFNTGNVVLYNKFGFIFLQQNWAAYRAYKPTQDVHTNLMPFPITSVAALDFSWNASTTPVDIDFCPQLKIDWFNKTWINDYILNPYTSILFIDPDL